MIRKKIITNKMAEVAGPSLMDLSDTRQLIESTMETCEPEKKKPRIEDKENIPVYKLEERLNGILCCAVCLDLPNVAVYQCPNGHLMCASCLAHLLADARLKDESATCPNCRCEISKAICSRNLAVEKAISELPAECQYCSQQFPRSTLEHHELHSCPERLVRCPYERIGCPWKGPNHELGGHQASCQHPGKSGKEVMEALQLMDNKQSQSLKLFDNIFNLLSFEKIAFSDLQMRPYRTDDFITKLFFETSRFTAFNLQWVVKANVNDNQKNPNLSSRRSLSYQLVLKSKVTTPINLHYMVLRGPYGETKIDPAIYQHEFTSENTDSPYQALPIPNSCECNKLLAAKTISLRVIMFQIQK